MAVIKRSYRSHWVNARPWFRRWIYAQARAAQEHVHYVVPELFVETTLTCNARCIMCAHSERRMVGRMSMTLFEKAIRDGVEMGVKHVRLVGYGEPLADPLWLDRVRFIRRHDLTYDFISNASLLQPEVLELMFEMGGWSDVRFSVNGFSRQVYEQVMPPLKRDETYDKIEMFLDMKRRRGLSRPKVVVSCINLRENRSEVADFVRFWRSKPGVDRVSLGDCGDWAGAVTKPGVAVEGKHRGRRTRHLVGSMPRYLADAVDTPRRDRFPVL